MQRFDPIRPFYDTEVNEAIQSAVNHPMMKALMSFTFPDVEEEVWKNQLKRTHSIRDFQCNFIYKSVQNVLAKSSEGLTTSGFEKLQPNTSYRVATNTGLSYLAKRSTVGPHWLFEYSYAQKLDAKAPLSAAWQTRIGRRWLAVNQRAESFEFALSASATAQSVVLSAVPELTGYVVVRASDFGGFNQIVDASISDIAAFMCLKIPGNYGRDLNDLRIEPRSGEEWIRIGSFVFRPAQSVPTLIAGNNVVSVGEEGYAEWRAVSEQRVLSTTGVSAWKLFDASLKLIAQGSGDATAHSATAGSRFLLYGAARSEIIVTAA